MKTAKVANMLVGAILLVALVVGCAPAAPTATPKPVPPTAVPVPPTAVPEPIKIGGIGPLTPPGAVELGQEVMQALQLRIDEINEAGGLLGRPVELVFEDSAGTPEKGTAAAEKLITRDNVVAIAGEGHSSAFLAEMEVAHRENVLILPAECWSDQIRLKGYPEVFAMAPSNSLVFRQIAEFMKGAGFERPYILSEDTDYGIESLELLKLDLDAAGFEYDGMVVDRTTKDFVPFLLAVQNFKPDILVSNVTGVGAYLIIKQAKEIGLAPSATTALFSTASETGFPEMWEAAGPSAQYVIWNTPYHPTVEFSDLTKPFVENYTSTYSRAPVSTGFQAYDAMLAIEEAIRRSGSTDTEKMIEVLEGVSFMGTRGEIAFPTEKGKFYHQGPAPLVFVQFTEVNMQADETEILWPLEHATTEVQKPSE